MQSSHSSSSDTNNQAPDAAAKAVATERQTALQKTPALWRRLLTWFCRLAFGSTFIYSGFVKAVDPWGTFYKFNEYFEALGIGMIPNLMLTCVFVLCAVEFLIGIYVLLGCYRRSTPLLGIMFMAVMLSLTLWIVIKDPVADCGCFGDALVISNWATFWKNIVLTLMIGWLFKYESRTYALVTPALQWVCAVVSIAFICTIGAIGYFRQPLIDFRPYPVGEAIYSDDEEVGPEYVFVYTRGKEEKTFSEDDELPSEEDGWVFKERKEVGNEASRSAADTNSKTFRIWDESGNTDMTAEVFENNSKVLMLLIPDLATVSPATTWKINELCDYATKNNVEMIGVVAASPELISEWEELSMPEYEILTAEDTAIKEVARGNPALVYVEDKIVKWKTTLSAVDTEEFTIPEKREIMEERLTRGTGKIKLYAGIYICLLGVLIALSIFPRMLGGLTHGGKAHRVESSSPDKSAQ